MPNKERSNETVLFDPEQLQLLVRRLSEIRQRDPQANVDTVLAGLDETTRSLYREPLRQYLDSENDDLDMEATQMRASMDSEAMDGTMHVPPLARPDATIDGQQASAAAQRPATPKHSSATPSPSSKVTPGKDKRPPSNSSRTPVESHPESIDKFKIEKELGRGAFGVVYLAVDTELHRKVAIKVSHVSDKKIQERLRVEASKAAQIDSEGIVPVYHIGSTETGATYIVQKFIQGSSLRDWLDEHGPMSPADAARMIRSIALALEPAHLIDILHRDLKPDNVLIDQSGKPFIADFGLAISEEEQQGRRGELAGTPAYMSPEQIKGRIDFLDPRSDLWSLGVMLYELLCGKVPFSGRDRRALTEQICEMDPRPLQQRSPNLPESLNDVFLKCCAKKPSERYASVRDLAVALELLLAEGLSNQTIRGSTSTNLYSDSSFAGGSTRTATSRGSTEQGTRSSQQGSQSLHGSQSIQHGSSRESHVSMTSSTRTVTSTQQYGPPSPWWVRWLGQLVTLAVMAVASGIVAYVVSRDSGSVVVANNSPNDDPGTGGGQSNADIGTSKNNSGVKTIDDSSTVEPIPVEITKPEPPMPDVDGSPEKPWIVNPAGGGSHKTIQAAIDAGPAGAVITVVPGKYTEQLRIARPVTILGQQSLGRCELVNATGPPLTIVCQPDEAVIIRDFTIDAQGHHTTQQFNAIDVESGTFLIERSTLLTTSYNCIKGNRDTSIAAIDCKFQESRQFAISCTDHRQAIIKGCSFRLSGLQLIGGPAEVTGSTFIGTVGIEVDRSLPDAVLINDCTFDGCLEVGVSTTNNGVAIIRDSKFLLCKTGVQARFVDESDLNQKSKEVPGSVEVFNTKFSKCFVAALVSPGTLILRDKCEIREGQMGINIDHGNVTSENSSILDVKENGITVINDGIVTLNKTDIQHAGLRGIDMLAGSLTINGGSISNNDDAGIYVGDVADAVKLVGVTIENNRHGGLLAEPRDTQLQVSVNDSRFIGGDYNIFFKATKRDSSLDLSKVTFDSPGQHAIYASGPLNISFTEDCDFGKLTTEQRFRVFEPATVTKK